MPLIFILFLESRSSVNIIFVYARKFYIHCIISLMERKKKRKREREREGGGVEE